MGEAHSGKVMYLFAICCIDTALSEIEVRELLPAAKLRTQYWGRYNYGMLS